jgi:predicted transcriptional regulator
MNRTRKSKAETTPFSMRIDTPTYTKLRRIAEKDERSVAFVVAKAIEAYLSPIRFKKEA